MSAADHEPTLVECGDGGLVAVSHADGRVVVQWYGPRRAALTVEAARTLGYVLRGHARLADPGNEPGS